MAPRTALIWLVGVALLASACSTFLTSPMPRVSQLVEAGDERFRASQRLVLEGLDADVEGQTARARGRYERALQIDSSNPWAYLAIARQHLEAGEARRALRLSERAAALLESLDQESPGALLHCDGIRGAALALLGRHDEARPLLAAAARGAPRIWGDGMLSASELR